MVTKEKRCIQVKINEDLAEQADEILEDLGLNQTVLITALYKRLVAQGRVPFELALTDREIAERNFQKNAEKLPHVTISNAEDWNKLYEDK